MVQACAHTASLNIFVWTAKGLDYVSTERSARYVAIAMVLESVSIGGVNISVPKAVAREGACTESGKRYVPNVEEVVCAFTESIRVVAPIVEVLKSNGRDESRAASSAKTGPTGGGD